MTGEDRIEENRTEEKSDRMPDRYIDLFIRFVWQNDGKLSANKREKYFDFLSDQEVEELEKHVKLR